METCYAYDFKIMSHSQNAFKNSQQPLKLKPLPSASLPQKKKTNNKQKQKTKEERKKRKKREKKKKKPVKTMTDNRVAVTLCGVGGK